MKGLFFIALVFLHGILIAQQNPWLPKGENPWINYPGNEVVIMAQTDSAVTVEDTLMTADKSSSFVKTVDPGDEDYRAVIITEPVSADSTMREAQLVEVARDEAFDLYPAGGDFAFGFSMGLLFNVFSIPTVDVIYMAPESKNEKKTIQRVIQNPEYKSVDDEKLKKAVKTKVKGRKIGMTIAGGLAGSLTQCLILLGIAIA